jgi:hypothetical protein
MLGAPRWSGLVVVVLLSGASVAHARLIGNMLSPDKLVTAKLAAATAAANKLATAEVAPTVFAANPSGVADLLATEDGREVLSFLVSCALPEGSTLLADGTPFLGEIGLAPSWLGRRLNAGERGWVSACLFARTSMTALANPLSLRGPHPALEVSEEEAGAFTLEEGAFYGDYFVPAVRPVIAVACRGEDQAAGEIGGLILRDCAEPDPGDPTRTPCGFAYAGDCGDFASAHACEAFSAPGFYEDCHDQPISEDDDSQTFRQVITVYVLPPLGP